MKKLLVFGFEPYGRNRINISEPIIKTLKNNKISKKIILPIAFIKNRIMEKIKKAKPDIILGLAQHPRARKIRIERKAKNIIKLKKERESRPISKNSKKELFTNLKILKTNETTISYDAGTYVCNFSIYTIVEYIKKNNKNIKFGFLHIPKHYNINKGIRIVNNIINNLKNK